MTSVKIPLRYHDNMILEKYNDLIFFDLVDDVDNIIVPWHEAKLPLEIMDWLWTCKYTGLYVNFSRESIWLEARFSDASDALLFKMTWL